MAQPETEDQRAERLLRIGLDMAVRIREEPPDAVARTMHGLDQGELRDLALLMAACVDVGRPVREVVWWTELDRMPPRPRHIQPCGTHAAYNRHRAKGEPVDLACEVAERQHNAERYQQRKRPPSVHRLSTGGSPDSSTDGAGEELVGEERLAA